MSGEGLVELARRYVTLSDELESVRDQIKLAVLNGAGGEAPHPLQPARSSGGMNPKAAMAQAAESEIIALLQSTPGLKTSQIAAQTNAKTNTTVERLRRMKERGQIARDEGGGWQVGAAPG
jgi:hypothetical protein